MTITDNAKFGSTYSAKKVALNGPADPMFGAGPGSAAAIQQYNDLYDDELDGDGTPS